MTKPEREKFNTARCAGVEDVKEVMSDEKAVRSTPAALPMRARMFNMIDNVVRR
jgi:hypothetical protein